MMPYSRTSATAATAYDGNLFDPPTISAEYCRTSDMMQFAKSEYDLWAATTTNKAAATTTDTTTTMSTTGATTIQEDEDRNTTTRQM